MPNPSSSPTPINDEKSLQNHDEPPKACFFGFLEIHKWEGFWFKPSMVKSAIAFRSTFEARDDDVLLSSPIKTGTTWLKSIALCILMQNPNSPDILTTASPHFHVPTVEAPMTYSPQFDTSAPRLLHTHFPYSVLPDSIKNSRCKIVYIARNPKDTLISMWHFFNSNFGPRMEGPFTLENAVDCFCSGVHLYGSFFDHVVEYWLESQKRPEKVLFVKYEELKSDPKRHVAKIAEFLGRPFGDEGEVEEVVWRCSLERVKNLEVNKSGSVIHPLPNSSYFRKGEVGDWKNYLTSEMEERIDQISRVKLEPFGLFL